MDWPSLLALCTFNIFTALVSVAVCQISKIDNDRNLGFAALKTRLWILFTRDEKQENNRLYLSLKWNTGNIRRAKKVSVLLYIITLR